MGNSITCCFGGGPDQTVYSISISIFHHI